MQRFIAAMETRRSFSVTKEILGTKKVRSKFFTWVDLVVLPRKSYFP